MEAAHIKVCSVGGGVCVTGPKEHRAYLQQVADAQEEVLIRVMCKLIYDRVVL